MNVMKIGWIGLGHMGIPMAANLRKAGHEITVWNRNRAKAEELLRLGAKFADHPADLWADADVIFTMVSDDQAVKDVYLGEHGLLTINDTYADSGKIAIDMSTVAPEISRFLAAECQSRGIAFLDAPVSGSVQPARDGALIIMVGGEKQVFEQISPLFAVLGKLSMHLGEHGSGSKAKLAINLLLGITVQGIAEAVQFAKNQGIAPADMLQIINEGAVGSGISRGKTKSILENAFPAAFPLKHMAKDLRLAHEAGATTPLAEAVYANYGQALQHELGDEDVMAILRLLQR